MLRIGLMISIKTDEALPCLDGIWVGFCVTDFVFADDEEDVNS